MRTVSIYSGTRYSLKEYEVLAGIIDRFCLTGPNQYKEWTQEYKLNRNMIKESFLHGTYMDKEETLSDFVFDALYDMEYEDLPLLIGKTSMLDCIIQWRLALGK